jgi:fructokinase
MILVCGEALMDVFAGADTAGGLGLEARVGGSPFNVAVGLARLGQNVSFLGAISQDFLGERLLRALRSEGVSVALIERVEAPTTLSLVGLNAAGVPSYAFYGDGGADRQLRIDLARELPTDVSAIHVGSFSTVVEPIAATLRALVERERNRALVSCDLNVRLQVRPAVREWLEALRWMQSHAHLLKVSEEDLAQLRPGVEPATFIDEALHQGVALAVVTLGDRGALAATSANRVAVGPQPVHVVDTVGAGDSFQAALLAWLGDNGRLSADGLRSLTQADLAAGTSYAARAAGITCSRVGADLPRIVDLAVG